MASSESAVHSLFILMKPYMKMTHLKDIDMCNAVIKVIPRDQLKGVQRVGSLWRIYTNTQEARTQLAVHGIDLQHQHINLMTSNPFIHSNTESGRPIKITIFDVKLHVESDKVEKHLKSLGAKLVKTVAYCRVRDETDNETEFINGNRVTFAEAEYTRSHPLPQWVLIGNSVAKIKHVGQPPKADVCTKCFSREHPVWRCKNGQSCHACHQSKHTEGSEACPFFIKNSHIRVFGGRKDVLSNFHPCSFSYNNVEYDTREHAYQHQKAQHCNSHAVANEIVKTKDPGAVKKLSYCVTKDNIWGNIEETVMEDICYTAAQQNE